MKQLLENWRKYLKEDKGTVDPKLTEVAFNSMSALTAFDGGQMPLQEAAQIEYLVSEASNPNGDVVRRFHESLYSGERVGYLTPYSMEDLAGMDLYVLGDHNAGFAIKESDDIVSVHNNSSLKGLSSEFMRKAKEVGGTRLDHFDGFLSGLYRKHGFTTVYEVYQWGEQYRPEHWNYDPVDIFNSKTSVYAGSFQELMHADENPDISPGEIQQTLPNEEAQVDAESGVDVVLNPKLKYNSYLYGRPDVVFRRL